MVDAVVLDVNETLFSLDPVAAAFDEIGVGAGAVPLWFARVLRDGFAATATGDFVAFPALARHNARVLLDATDRPATDDDDRVERVVAAFDEVRPHRDVASGLGALRTAGLRLVAFTNGSAPIVTRFLERSGLDEVVEEALDVSIVGTWKPGAAAYQWVVGHLGLVSEQVAMLAVHPWDVAGAMSTGMVGAWLDRDGDRWPGWLPPADVTGTTMGELAGALLSR